MIALAIVAAWLVVAERLRRLACRWYVRVGDDGTKYSFQDSLCVSLRLRQGYDLFGDHEILVGSVSVDDEDYDEKFVELEFKARAMAKRINKVGRP